VHPRASSHFCECEPAVRSLINFQEVLIAPSGLSFFAIVAVITQLEFWGGVAREDGDWRWGALELGSWGAGDGKTMTTRQPVCQCQRRTTPAAHLLSCCLMNCRRPELSRCGLDLATSPGLYSKDVIVKTICLSTFSVKRKYTFLLYITLIILRKL